MASETLHVPREALSAEARLLHYALTSLMEELEAVEHASMLIEWLRRHNSDFAGHLKTYLFTDRPITGIEKAAEAAEAGAAPPRPGARPDLAATVGSLKGQR